MLDSLSTDWWPVLCPRVRERERAWGRVGVGVNMILNLKQRNILNLAFWPFVSKYRSSEQTNKQTNKQNPCWVSSNFEALFRRPVMWSEGFFFILASPLSPLPRPFSPPPPPPSFPLLLSPLSSPWVSSQKKYVHLAYEQNNNMIKLSLIYNCFCLDFVSHL